MCRSSQWLVAVSVCSSARKNNPPRPPRSLPKPRALNFRQQAFVDHFTDPKSQGFLNRTKAAGCARYRGNPGSNQLAVQGCRLLRNPDVVHEIMARFHKAGATPEACARSLARALNAREMAQVLNENGEPEFKPVPRWDVQLQAQKNYLRFLELCVRYAQSKPRARSASAPAASKGKQVDNRSRRSMGQAENSFAKLPQVERTVSREAISAAEAWAEIEKRTRAAQGTSAEAGSDENPPDAAGCGDPSQDDPE